MPPDPTGMVYIGNPIVSRDGRSYAYSQFRKLADLYVVDNLG
jgi:hypothetical protein